MRRRDFATLDLFGSTSAQDAPRSTDVLTPVLLLEGAPARLVAPAGAVPGLGPILQGPVSPDTGGSLNAKEALRVATLKSIEVTGRKFQDGRVVCVKHKDLVLFGEAGFRSTVYAGPNAKLLGKCDACKKPVYGEEG
jgi:hypothetical protein